MKKTRVFAAVFILLFAAVSPAFAKLINGKISSVDAGMKKLTLQTTDAATGKVSESEMWINEGADFGNAGSLEALKSGDDVWVEAEQDSEGNLKVSKVSKA